MNTVIYSKRILAVLAAATVTLMQLAMFAHSTATYIA